jgi:hypothetical protein
MSLGSRGVPSFRNSARRRKGDPDASSCRCLTFRATVRGGASRTHKPCFKETDLRSAAKRDVAACRAHLSIASSARTRNRTENPKNLYPVIRRLSSLES